MVNLSKSVLNLRFNNIETYRRKLISEVQEKRRDIIKEMEKNKEKSKSKPKNEIMSEDEAMEKEINEMVDRGTKTLEKIRQQQKCIIEAQIEKKIQKEIILNLILPQHIQYFILDPLAFYIQDHAAMMIGPKIILKILSGYEWIMLDIDSSISSISKIQFNPNIIRDLLQFFHCIDSMCYILHLFLLARILISSMIKMFHQSNIAGSISSSDSFDSAQTPNSAAHSVRHQKDIHIPSLYSTLQPVH